MSPSTGTLFPLDKVAPVVFSFGEHQAAGSLWGPRESTSGVVIVDAFGIEALATDQALNCLAAALAGAGHRVLRYSAPGAGDSSDLDPAESFLSPAKLALNAGIDLLRNEGIQRVALVGLRVGAALAAAIATERRDVSSLVLWAPTSGRLFAREFKLLGSSSALAGSEDGKTIVEAGGFAMNQSTREDFATLDPATLSNAASDHLLILDREDFGLPTKTLSALRMLHPDLDHEIDPGYQTMRPEDPEYGEVPEATIRRIVDWIDSHDRSADALERSVGSDRPDQSAVPTSTWLALPNNGRESSVRIPVAQGSISAVVTEPAQGDRQHEAPVFVFLTTGSNIRSGAGRLHVKLARDLAKRGVVSLRVDRRGIGTSVGSVGKTCMGFPAATPGYPVEGLGPAYNDVHVYDVESIQKYVQDTFGTSRYILVGTCSGAFVAYHAAFGASGPEAVISINQIIFDDPSWSTTVESPAMAIRARFELERGLRDPRRWLSLLRGEIPIGPAVRRLWRFVGLRVANKIADLRDQGGVGHGPERDLRIIAAKGIKQIYVFDSAETGLGYLDLAAKRAIHDLSHARTLRKEVVSGAGHTFGPQALQTWLADALPGLLSDVDIKLPEPL